MGLFDALTGGAAKVFVEVDEMERGKAGQVVVRCQSTGAK